MPFQRIEHDQAVFVYEPEHPIYHLKQGSSLSLQPEIATQVRSSMKLRFSNYEECSDMQISTAQPAHRSVGGTFVQMSNGGLELKVDRHQFPDLPPADFSLAIPDGCVLYLSKIERWIPVSDTDQVMHSDLNNRPAELHGLESEEIFNLEKVSFFTKLDDRFTLDLHQLEETHATFVSELGERAQLFLPQNFNFVIFDSCRRYKIKCH